MLNSYPYTVWFRIIVYIHMSLSLHVLLTDVCFTAIRPLVPLLSVVYTPNVTGKGDALTKPSTAHRTDVGLLTIVYSPDVNEEIRFL